jgi:calcineurin-like phosphoesterase family protein
MAIWLTSDTHFGHANIIAYSKRPYPNVEAMNADITARWNAVVAPCDVVYHLGDFAMGVPDRWPGYRAALNGGIVLVCGNHDRHLRRVLGAMNFADVIENVVVELEGVRCWLNHYPPTPDHRGVVKRPSAPGPHDLALCGHVHDAWLIHDNVVNVGVDVWGFRPIRISDALAARDASSAALN